MIDGLYYVKEKHGVEVGDWDSDHKKWNGIWGGDDAEVLAPVPTYEEYVKLKELLGDCKRRIEEAFYTNENAKWLAQITIEEINEALGEYK